MKATLPETSIFAPENGWLEYNRFLLRRPIFCGYVNFRECTFFDIISIGYDLMSYSLVFQI